MSSETGVKTVAISRREKQVPAKQTTSDRRRCRTMLRERAFQLTMAASRTATIDYFDEASAFDIV
jgi:hypothetical protein